MTKKEAITVTYCNVEYQSGGSDCELFGVNFATSLCLGQDPDTLLYDQPLMQNRPLFCIVAGDMSDFPQQSIRRKTMQEV